MANYTRVYTIRNVMTFSDTRITFVSVKHAMKSSHLQLWALMSKWVTNNVLFWQNANKIYFSLTQVFTYIQAYISLKSWIKCTKWSEMSKWRLLSSRKVSRWDFDTSVKGQLRAQLMESTAPTKRKRTRPFAYRIFVERGASWFLVWPTTKHQSK